MDLRVSSVAIDRIAYDDASAYLDVWFDSGHRYRYLGVPRETFEQLRAAGSVGQFFNRMIRREYTFLRFR